MRACVDASLSLLAALGLAVALAGPAWSAPPVAVEAPWARATAPGQPAGGGFLTLHNRGGADRLVAASSPVAERVELHRMALDGDVMRMREVEAIELPAGGRVALAPGGLHLMFMGLKQPLKAGSRLPLTLSFEKAGTLTVQVEVKAVGHDHSSGGHKH